MRCLKALLNAVIFAAAIIGAGIQFAYAATLDELAEKVEQTSAEYNSAVAEQERVAGEISELDGRISELESQLPELESRANTAAVQLYKQGGGHDELLEMFLRSDNLFSAIEAYQNYNAIFECRMNRVSSLKDAKLSIEKDKMSLADELARADELVAQSKAALDEATSARTEAQEAAAAQEAAERSSASSSALASDIDWTMPKSEFVAHWGSRINAYLAGSPLGGYGELFAESAYRSGSDPRWSPAISLVESSKGAVCFRPHNAWGWMGQSFGSWEEAIPAHVQYLAGPLYGGYLTMSGAATYCPPGGPWYEKVAAEMRKI